MKEQIYVPEWLLLPKEYRDKLVKMFELKEDVGREVAGNQVLSDGYSNDALKGITLEKINAQLPILYTDFMIAINALIESFKPKLTEENLTKAINEFAVPNNVTEPLPINAVSGDNLSEPKCDKRSKEYREWKKLNK
jgi:hypothetical protein